jgi:hypothetical protein
MAQVRERNTGSIVNVPDEKVDQVLALGYYELVKDSKPAKSTAKKASTARQVVRRG